MNKGYVAFVGILAVLWLIMMVIDVAMTIYLYRPDFIPLSQISFPLFVIVPVPVLLAFLPGTFTAIWIGVVTGSVVIFLFILVYRSLSKFRTSSLFMLAEFFALNYFLSYVYILLISAAGHPVSSPPLSPKDFVANLFSLTNAGLYEELITRVLYIGVPLFVYYGLSRSGRLSPLRPKKLPWWRIIWGGGYKFGKPEIVVLVISSLIFGIAHVPSWDLSKLPQAALGGVFLGALYLRFGLFADVLFHFSIDSPDLLYIQGYGNPIASVGSTAAYAIFILIFVIAGVVVSIAYLLQIRGRSRRSSGAAMLQPRGPAMTDAKICPYCGSSAVYFFSDEYFRCDECGRLIGKGQ